MNSHVESIKQESILLGLKNIERFNPVELNTINNFFRLCQNTVSLRAALQYDADFKNSLAKALRSYTDRLPLSDFKSQGVSRNFKLRLKDKNCKWSKRAVEVMNKYLEEKEKLVELLYEEHIVNCEWFFNQLINKFEKDGEVSINFIADILHNYFKVVVLTKEEARLLDGDKNKKFILDGIEYYGLGLKYVPADWDGVDTFYRAHQIPLFEFGNIGEITK